MRAANRGRALPFATTLTPNTDIEVLRAVAVGLVVVCHLHNLITWRGALNPLLVRLSFWGGVDLFFCISGFVIAGSLLRMARGGSFRRFAVPFYVRRIFRIWPAAILWLIIPLAAARFFNSSGAFGHFKATLLDGAAAVLQLANAYFSVCTASRFGPCGKEAIFWSLSLEEQFYLLFPLALFFVPRRWLLQGLGLLILVQFFLPREADHALWYFRTDAICYGVLIAFLRHRSGSVAPMSSAVASASLAPASRAMAPMHRLFALTDRLANHRRLAGLISLLLIASIAFLTALPPFRVSVGLLALASAGLVWIASFNQNLILPWKALRPFLVWAGSRSYSIYLVHDPCIWATREIFHRLFGGAEQHDAFAPAFLLVALMLIFVTAESTFLFVESPLRELGRRIADRGRLRSAELPAASVNPSALAANPERLRTP